MSKDARIFTVLIASPGNMTEYRDAVEHTILEWSTDEAIRHSVVFIPQRWERNTSSEIAEGIDAQDVINRHLGDPSDCLISLWWNRLGTQTPRAESGTAEELQRHMAAGKRCSVYRCTLPIPPELKQTEEDNEQLTRLNEFLGSLQGLMEGFADVTELRTRVRRRLARWAEEIVMEEAEQRRSEKAAELIVDAVPTAERRQAAASPYLALTLSPRQALQDFIIREARAYTALIESDPFQTADVREAALAVERQMAPSLDRVAQLAAEDRASKVELAPLIVEWVEALASHPIQVGRVWRAAIRGYGGYLLFRTMLLAELRAGSAPLSAAACKKWVYMDQRNRMRPLLEALSWHSVFKDGADTGLDPEGSQRSTPVSDHVEPIISQHSTALSASTTAALFDLTELLIALKQAATNEYPDFGKYIWTSRSHPFIAEVLREEQNLASRTYEQRAIDDLFSERVELEQAAAAYDRFIGGGERRRFRIAYHPVTPLLRRSSPADPTDPWGEI